MPTPEPNPYRKLNYPVNNLQQDFTEAQKAQTRANIGIPASVGETGKVLGVSDASTGELGWVDQPSVPSVDQSYDATSAKPQSGTAVAEAISTKQDTISDLSDIRSGAALGTTSVQPADLAPYATTSDMNTALAGKQDVINDLSTIRSGAALGATSVQDVTVDGVSVVSGGVAAITTSTFTQQQANWAESDTSSVSYIQNKPSNLVQDANYVHTDNNFTNADATKLSGIEANAEVNVQSDWSEADSSSDAFIKNKPQNLVQDASYVHTDNNFTNADATKLSGIEAGAEVNVQSDWSESDSSSDAYIQNKPDLSIYAQSANLATVATTGDYSDLVNKPAIPAAQVNSDWNSNSGVSQILNKPQLATVATTGDYGDLINKPSIPAAQVQSNWSESDSSAVSYIQNKPSNLVQDASYVHTDENFTSAEKTKLAGIAAGAEVNVQSDWTESDSSSDAYIQNKPQNLVQDASYVHTDENFTSAEKTKLAGIEANAEVNVQSDWNESDSSSDAYIQNKPAIRNVPAVTSSDDGKVLKATYSGGTGSYSWETETGATYTAGDAIDITNNEISVVYDMDTLDVVAQTVTDSVTTGDGIFDLPSSIQSFITQNTPVLVTVHFPGNMLVAGGRADFRFALLSSTDYPWDVAELSLSLDYEEVDGEYFISEQDIEFELPVTVANHWSQQLSSAVAFSISDGYGSIAIGGAVGDLQSDPITFTYAVSTPKLAVKNPLPSSTSADEGKVLKVDANGDPEWATGGGGSQVQSDWAETDTTDPSYIENKPTPKTLVAGQGIAISESSASLTVTNTVARDAVNLIAGQGVTLTQSGRDLTVAVDTSVVATQNDLSSKQDTMSAGTGIVINQNAISVSVPISVVSALPASPDPNTLYVVTGA